MALWGFYPWGKAFCCVLTGHITKANCVYRQLCCLSGSQGHLLPPSTPLPQPLHCIQLEANCVPEHISPFEMLTAPCEGWLHCSTGRGAPATHSCLRLSASRTSLQGEKENKSMWMIGLVMTLEIPLWQCTKSSLKALKSFLKIWAPHSMAGPGQVTEPTSLSHAGSSLPCPKTLPFQLGLTCPLLCCLSFSGVWKTVMAQSSEALSQPLASQPYTETVQLNLLHSPWTA